VSVLNETQLEAPTLARWAAIAKVWIGCVSVKRFLAGNWQCQ